MRHALGNLTPDFVRRVLVETGDAVPTVTPRMQRFDEHGRLHPRLIGPPPGQVAARAAVAVLIYPWQEGLTLALTRRADHLPRHAGQISFPGGGVEPGDPSDLHTALRETQEELGIDPAELELWTPLKRIYVPASNYQVSPFVMYAASRPEFRPDAAEVAEVLEVPLANLLQPETFTSEVRELNGARMRVPYFRHQSHKIWGATAIILDQLIARVQTGLGHDHSSVTPDPAGPTG